MTTRDRLRTWANIGNGSTLLGLAIARLGGARPRRWRGGLWLAEGYRWSFPAAGAFTVGDVVVTSSTFAHLEHLRPGTLAHERRHAAQYAYCLGLPFLPAYAATMAWSWWRTGDRAARCFFEREAGLASGGYVDVPLRAMFVRRRDERGLNARG